MKVSKFGIARIGRGVYKGTPAVMIEMDGTGKEHDYTALFKKVMLYDYPHIYFVFPNGIPKGDREILTLVRGMAKKGKKVHIETEFGDKALPVFASSRNVSSLQHLNVKDVFPNDIDPSFFQYAKATDEIFIYVNSEEEIKWITKYLALKLRKPAVASFVMVDRKNIGMVTAVSETARLRQFVTVLRYADEV